jgi:hypothetical protein
LSKIKEELVKLGDLNGEPHCKACCELIAHKSYGRYLKMDEQGQPHIDKAKVKAEERLEQVPDQNLRRYPFLGGCGSGLQATVPVGECLPHFKDHPGTAAGLHHLETASAPISCSAG